MEELRSSIPPVLFHRSVPRFLVSLGYSLSLTIMTGYLAYQLIPLTSSMIPLWILYAFLNGTISFGLWILGHECGHGAFSSNSTLNDILGFILHSLYLVPYFSWQHSHAVHHSRTNHLTEGESHVPILENTELGQKYIKAKNFLGEDLYAVIRIIFYMVLGFPSYLWLGFSGGPARGYSSHFFVPNELFPKKLMTKVILSNLGLISVLIGLYIIAQKTSFALVMAVYGGPYLVGNMWLTGYTYLHHTNINVPFYEGPQWNWLKGALGTIDRAYPEFINALHFEIGNTHVLHHIFPELPHYNAVLATDYLKKTLGSLYNYDGRSPFYVLYELAKIPVYSKTGEGKWEPVPDKKVPAKPKAN